MIDLEFGDYHIQKEKESYELIDSIQAIGGSNIAYVNVDGKTRIQKKRIRDDGFLIRYGMKLFCTYEEKEIIRKMVFGTCKTTIGNTATLTISDEGERNTMVRVISADTDFYEENAIIEDIDDVKEHPSQYGYNIDDVLYEIFVLFIKV